MTNTTTTMTNQHFDLLGKYIRNMADGIGLSEWTITLSHEPCEDHAGATVSPTDAARRATIKVNRDFLSYTKEEQTHVILHELLHLHLTPIMDIIRCDLWDARLLSQSSYQILSYSLKRQSEYAVDLMAKALSPMFQTIKWDNIN